MTEEAPQQEVDKTEIAAQSFHDLLPNVKRISGSLSAKALRRVFNAVIEFPLYDKPPRFMTKAENMLFVGVIKLLEHKTNLVQGLLKEQELKKENTDDRQTSMEESGNHPKE